MLINSHDDAQTEDLASQCGDLVKSGMAPHPASPAGAALLSAYNRWKARQSADQLGTASKAAAIAVRVTRDEAERARRKQAKKAARKLKRAREAMALAGPGLEERAMRRSTKRMRIALESGRSSAAAVGAGFECYRLEGGKLTEAQWKRKLQPPT